LSKEVISDSRKDFYALTKYLLTTHTKSKIFYKFTNTNQVVNYYGHR
jgi:hypothetical protein